MSSKGSCHGVDLLERWIKKNNYKKNNTRGGILVLEGVFETGKIRLVDCFFSFGFFLTTFTVTHVRCQGDFLSSTSCTYVFMGINILIMTNRTTCLSPSKSR